MGIKDLTCCDMYMQCTNMYGDYNAVQYLGNDIKKSEIDKHINIMSNYFKSLNMQPDDCFTIFLPTCVHALVAFYALNKIGVIANIVHPLTPPNALKEIMLKTKTKGILILDILCEDYLQVLASVDVPVLMCANSDYVEPILSPFFSFYEMVKHPTSKKIKNEIKYSQIIKDKKYNTQTDVVLKNKGNIIAVYLHSGGTSGESKTIMLTNFALNSLVHSMDDIKQDINVGQDYSVVALPLFHAYGLGVGVHTSLCNGVCAILVPKFNAKKINNLLRKNKVVFIAGVPIMFNKMMREDNFEGKHLKNLKYLYSGGDVNNTTMLTTFNNKIKKQGGTGQLFAGYGLTETCSVVCVNTYNENKEGSNGKSIANAKIEIWDENNKKVKPNTIGEIVISGDTIMEGYLHDDSGSNMHTDKNGVKWVYTGDYGYMDEEGYLFFKGRKKRVIKIVAFNIFPQEIEDIVLELPYVVDACAVEKVTSDGKNFIKLFITVDDKLTAGKDVKRLVEEHYQEKLIKYSWPKELVVLKEMPRTKYGKVDYLVLQTW